MFNKGNVFHRNESANRHDVPSVAGAGSSAASSAGVTANVVRESSPAQTPASPVASPTEIAQHPGQVMRAANPSGRAAAAEPRKASAGDSTIDARLLVGPDVKLKGAAILDCDTLVVEGRVEATMDSRVIRIAENGSFVGKVSIDIAEIHGTFEGELTARSQLIIHTTGRVSGKIQYGKLVVDEGGQLCGEVHALSEKTASLVRPPVEAPVAVAAVAG